MPGKHFETHTKEAEISPFKLRVKLTPEMTQELVAVLKAADSSPHVSDHTMDLGYALAAGQLDLLTALSTMKFLEHEIRNHHRAEGGEAAGLLADFMMKMSTSCEVEAPFTLVHTEKRRGRGSH